MASICPWFANKRIWQTRAITNEATDRPLALKLNSIGSPRGEIGRRASILSENSRKQCPVDTNYLGRLFSDLQAEGLEDEQVFSRFHGQPQGRCIFPELIIRTTVSFLHVSRFPVKSFLKYFHLLRYSAMISAALGGRLCKSGTGQVRYLCQTRGAHLKTRSHTLRSSPSVFSLD